MATIAQNPLAVTLEHRTASLPAIIRRLFQGCQTARSRACRSGLTAAAPKRAPRRTLHLGVVVLAEQRVEVDEVELIDAGLGGQSGRLAGRRVGGVGRAHQIGLVGVALLHAVDPCLVQQQLDAGGEARRLGIGHRVGDEGEGVVQTVADRRVGVLLATHPHLVAGHLVGAFAQRLRDDLHPALPAPATRVERAVDEGRQAVVDVDAVDGGFGHMHRQAATGEEAREIGQAADVVQVVVGQEEVHVAGCGQHGRAGRLEQPPQPGAGVEQKEARAVLESQAGRLAPSGRYPALRAQQRQTHRHASSLAWTGPACKLPRRRTIVTNGPPACGAPA